MQQSFRDPDRHGVDNESMRHDPYGLNPKSGRLWNQMNFHRIGTGKENENSYFHVPRSS